MASYLPWLSIQATASGSNGNHIGTTRLTYQVPSGRRTIIELLFLRLVEDVAVAASSYQVYTLVNGVVIALIASQNAVQDRTLTVPCHMHLEQGNTLVFQTYNASATTLTWQVSYKGKEHQ